MRVRGGGSIINIGFTVRVACFAKLRPLPLFQGCDPPAYQSTALAHASEGIRGQRRSSRTDRDAGIDSRCGRAKDCGRQYPARWVRWGQPEEIAYGAYPRI